MGIIGPIFSFAANALHFLADLLDKENSRSAIAAKAAQQHQDLKDSVNKAVAAGDIDAVRDLVAQ